MNDVLDQILASSTVAAIASAVGAALVALWLAAAWWAYADAARRTGSIPAALLVAAWIVVSTPLLVPLSLPIYALVRPAESAAERRTRRLAAELTGVLHEAALPGCPGCTKAVDPAWQRCPSCGSWLAVPCATCGSWSDPSLEVCPFCGGEDRAAAAVETPEPAFAAGRPRRARRRVRAMGPVRPEVLRPDPRRPALDGRPLGPVRVG